MREILFRGKRIDNGEWVLGQVVIRPDHDGGCEKYFICETEHRFIRCINKMPCTYEVDPETVGQYTGLKAKNGKRIFEGDIVDCWSEGVNAKGTVQQRKDSLWIIYPAWQKTIMWGLCPDEHCNTTVEVIGNIHDNPELIAEVQDGI